MLDTLFLVEYYALNPDGGNYLIKQERIFARDGEIFQKAKRRSTLTTQAIGIYRLERTAEITARQRPRKMYL
jgi:hypothetical protein